MPAAARTPRAPQPLAKAAFNPDPHHTGPVLTCSRPLEGAGLTLSCFRESDTLPMMIN